MEKTFHICDAAQDDAHVADLFYNTETERFRIIIDPSVNVSKLPLSLKMHAERGRYELNESFAMDWIRQRICPPSRHNISAILREAGLREYSEFGILSWTQGYSDMDDLYLSKEIGNNAGTI